jgi:hypothetical protein
VRRKIWGTDNPPGLKDPYGGEGVLERKFKKDLPENPDLTGYETIGVVERESEDVPPADYQPASTWEDIPRVGHLGRWSDLPAAEADAYNSYVHSLWFLEIRIDLFHAGQRRSMKGSFTDRLGRFMLKKKVTKKGHLSLAAHQAAVEVCLMHTLNKPLSKVCDVVEHDKSVFKMIWKSKIQPSANGQWSGAVAYPNKEAEKALIYIFEQVGSQPQPAVPEEAAEETAEASEASEFEESAPEWNASTAPFFGYADVRDKGFLSLPLSDPATKFAVSAFLFWLVALHDY